MISWTVVIGSPYSSEPREKTTSCCIGGGSLNVVSRRAALAYNRRATGFALGGAAGGSGTRPDGGGRPGRGAAAQAPERRSATSRAVAVAHPQAVLRAGLAGGLVARLREAQRELRAAVRAAPALARRADALGRHVGADRDRTQRALRGQVADPLDREPRRDRHPVDRLVGRAEQRVVDQVHVPQALRAGAAVHLVEARRHVPLRALPARPFGVAHSRSDRPIRRIALDARRHV